VRRFSASRSWRRRWVPIDVYIHGGDVEKGRSALGRRSITLLVGADVAGGRRGGTVTDVAGDVVEGRAVLAHRCDDGAPAYVGAEARRVDAERGRLRPHELVDVLAGHDPAIVGREHEVEAFAVEDLGLPRRARHQALGGVGRAVGAEAVDHARQEVVDTLTRHPCMNSIATTTP